MKVRPIAVALAVLTGIGCQAQLRTGPPTTTAAASASTMAPPALATAPGTPTPPVTRGVLDVLRGLPVDDRPPAPDKDHLRPGNLTYNRDRDWQPNGWGPPDAEGCDTRERVLRRDAVPGTVTLDRGCSPSGRWPLVYVDGEQVGKPGSAVQIDHTVALSDAWRSGGWRWFDRTATTLEGATVKMRAFTLDEGNLRAVDGPENIRKNDKGPADWQPPRVAAGCDYGTRYVAVKAAWALTITTRDRDAVGRLLETCHG